MKVYVCFKFQQRPKFILMKNKGSHGAIWNQNKLENIARVSCLTLWRKGAFQIVLVEES